MTGTTTISARATQQLNSFYFDLVLHTNKVTINGVPAEAIARGFSDVYVKPAQPIAAGSTFQVDVAYSGKPAITSKATGSHGRQPTRSGPSRGSQRAPHGGSRPMTTRRTQP